MWPQGFDAPFDSGTALIAIAAAVALLKFKLNVMQVIGASGLLGIGLQYAIK
jgi:chromate transporter